jgi:hypothetical protein
MKQLAPGEKDQASSTTTSEPLRLVNVEAPDWFGALTNISLKINHALCG